MIRIVRTQGHEYQLELVGENYVCKEIKRLDLNNWHRTRIGMKAKIIGNRIVFEDGEKTTQIQEG